MSKFEDNLWAELERDHGVELVKNAESPRFRSSWWLVAAAAAAVAVLGTGALVAPAYFSGTPPTSAVLDNPDDDAVPLTARDLGRFEEATEKLRAHGIPAVVVPVTEGCTDIRVQVEQGSVSRIPFREVKTGNGERAIAIVPDAIVPNAVPAIGMIGGSDGLMGGLALGQYPVGQVPACLQYTPPPPGLVPPTFPS